MHTGPISTVLISVIGNHPHADRTKPPSNSWPALSSSLVHAHNRIVDEFQSALIMCTRSLNGCKFSGYGRARTTSSNRCNNNQLFDKDEDDKTRRRRQCWAYSTLATSALKLNKLQPSFTSAHFSGIPEH